MHRRLVLLGLDDLWCSYEPIRCLSHPAWHAQRRDLVESFLGGLFLGPMREV
jgi:hypothetical protein